MNRWDKIKKEGWLACMLIGISLLTWAISQDTELFAGHIPIACLFILAGLSMEIANKN